MAQIAILATSAVLALNKGAQGRKLGYGQAEGLRDASMRRMAAATAEVSEGQRQKEFMYSRAMALAAFQGGSVDDPTMVALLGDLNAEGEYRILSKLYTGADETQALQYQSEQAMRAGDAALEQGYVGAITTVLSAYGSGIFGGGKVPELSHAAKAEGASLGMMDFNPGSGAAVYA